MVFASEYLIKLHFKIHDYTYTLLLKVYFSVNREIIVCLNSNTCELVPELS